ncbi:hypothetical protein SAMN04489729_2424 [Amycolatopsis lurida]|uniref:DUF7144 domain-containing protein n=1 Tax=Amycolatopsis lurida NRRL 2430 TaxID=1460371 RepID=A0A2P2FH59_AMYLU|nr:hypothetical protein [Amycolatopsis lurida]KFU76067.1 hypothetical protein BB31_38210 [Amycolatopsis lurida NRRL 2430]SEC77416.1 hypothetical protein SAMN04489729_2424 [Amycolatopsis lurida]
MSKQWSAGADLADRSGTRPVWAGWIVFASVIMLILGAFDVIAGIVALVRGDYYISGPEYSLVLDVTGWAWAHLVGGTLVAVSGVFLISGAIWARVVAVLFAAGNAVTHLVFLSAHPLWSMLVIALCVTVIWAVVVHGDAVPNRESW